MKEQHNVHTFRMALGDHDGKMKMNVSRNIETDDNIASSSSLLKPKTLTSSHPHIVFEKSEEVDVRTIDSWAAENIASLTNHNEDCPGSIYGSQF